MLYYRKILPEALLPKGSTTHVTLIHELSVHIILIAFEARSATVNNADFQKLSTWK